MREEQKRAQDELMHQMEEERDTLFEREREKSQQQGLEAYRTLMKFMNAISRSSGSAVITVAIAQNIILDQRY